jgi:hypothetical protein
MLGVQTDDCEIDRVRDLADRPVGADAGHRLSFEVDGEGGADEICFEDVAEELASDRATPARGADHGHRGRGEEWTQRGDAGRVLSFVATRPQCAGCGDGETELDLAALSHVPELEPGVFEHCQRRGVRCHHLGDEPFDAGVARPAGELLEQACADPAALLGVIDRERHLGPFASADTCVASNRDHALLTIAVG